MCRVDTLRLIEAGAGLASSHSPFEALQAWLAMFIDYIAGKRIVAEAVGSLITSSADGHRSSGADVRAALNVLYARAVGDGSISGEFDPVDLMRAIAGVAAVGARPGWERGAHRTANTLLEGLRQKG